MILKLPKHFKARQYQRNLLHAIFTDKYRHILSYIHRRSGKTETAINIIAMASVRFVGTINYLFPQTNQARRVIWEGINGAGMPFLDHVPGELIEKTNGATMSIKCRNGSRINFAGSNNFDALMGTNPRLIIYDEFPLQNPLARQYLSPILLENGGTEVILGTPRGRNHGFELFDIASQNPKSWFTQLLTVEDTHKLDGTRVITDEQIDEERRNGMSEELIQQEFYCSFDIGNLGAYYTPEMLTAQYEGRITDFAINPHLPIFCSWDIGVRDSTAICFFQKNGDTIDYIEYLDASGHGVDYWASQVYAIERKYGQKVTIHFGPHDLRQREWGSSAKTRIMIARDFGIHFQIVPQVSVQDRITAGRAHLRTCRFHSQNCKMLITCLREFMREYDEERRVFADKPLHNWASHGADAFTYGALAFREQFLSNNNQPFRYENKFA